MSRKASDLAPEMILAVENVSKTFVAGGGREVRALRGVDLDLKAGETVGVVGESGSGKSTLARVAVGFHSPDHGSVSLFGRELGGLSSRALRSLRGRIGFVYQEPRESVNPMWRIVDVIREPLDIHRSDMSKEERNLRALEALERVQLGSQYANRFAEKLSGGELQRVGIARAIILEPGLIILDEPTSSLDMSVQSRILELLRDLGRESQMAYLMISHNVDCVRYLTERVIVMYLGQVVEEGPTDDVLSDPLHPYTEGLMSARLHTDPTEELAPFKLEGTVGRASQEADHRESCLLCNRCPIEIDECSQHGVKLALSREDRYVRCIRRTDVGRALEQKWKSTGTASLG